ncbi:MAG: 50S ribosomal protein L5 [Planctomycetes bacterium]|nr:50S ribosomal protein L5 [Planctomycetota bacterium]MBL7007731.1 50S ribosomal protein L5 [Planctomycetota bacterium]
MTRLSEKYTEEIHPKLMERFSFDNSLQAPHLKKIVVSMGVGQAVENKARVEAAAKELSKITGQKSMITKAKKSVAGFKVREGMPVGAVVTLRGARMFEFLDRLISVVLPRIRDFQGVKDNFDGRGNFSLGLTEQSLFPEIDLDKVEYQQGMNVTFVTSAQTDEEGRALLEAFGMPFRRPDEN